MIATTTTPKNPAAPSRAAILGADMTIPPLLCS
jgi:hypothetical protein